MGSENPKVLRKRKRRKLRELLGIPTKDKKPDSKTPTSSGSSSTNSELTPTSSPPQPGQYQYHLVVVPLGERPRVFHYPDRALLVDHLQKLVSDPDRLASTRLFAFHARRLGLSALPYPTLIDGEELIGLAPPPGPPAGEDSGCLVPGMADGETNTVVDYANPPEEEDAGEEDEPKAAAEDASDEEESDPVDEDLDDDAADEVVAGVIAGTDMYEGEPEGEPE